jgi:hypothetical protein
MSPCHHQELKKELFQRGVLRVRVTEFSQGRTMRWGLAWSLKGMFPEATSNSAPEPSAAKLKAVINISWDRGFEELVSEIVDCFEAVGIGCTRQGQMINCTIDDKNALSTFAEVDPNDAAVHSMAKVGNSSVEFHQQSGDKNVRVEIGLSDIVVEARRLWISTIESLLMLKCSGEL